MSDAPPHPAPAQGTPPPRMRASPSGGPIDPWSWGAGGALARVPDRPVDREPELLAADARAPPAAGARGRCQRPGRFGRDPRRMGGELEAEEVLPARLRHRAAVVGRVGALLGLVAVGGE